MMTEQLRFGTARLILPCEINAQRSIGEELLIRVKIAGTTFTGVYEVLDGVLWLRSQDVPGDCAVVGDAVPEELAAKLLRGLAERAIRTSEIPFMRDDGAVSG